MPLCMDCGDTARTAVSSTTRHSSALEATCEATGHDKATAPLARTTADVVSESTAGEPVLCCVTRAHGEGKHGTSFVSGRGEDDSTPAGIEVMVWLALADDLRGLARGRSVAEAASSTFRPPTDVRLCGE
jgi:hypothetical protein